MAFQTRRAQRVDRCKHMALYGGPLAVIQPLAEGQGPRESHALRFVPRLVPFELMCIRPVLVEGLLHLRDQGWLIRLRHANVPFETVSLSGMREVR